MAPSVKVRLEVDGTPEAIAAIRQFTAQAKTSGKEASGAFAGFAGAFSGVQGLLGQLGIVIGTAEFAKFTAETIQAAFEQKHLAEQLGTTVTNMSALSIAARLNNTDQKALSTGLGILAKRFDDLRAGVPSVVALFARLRDAQGQPLTAKNVLVSDDTIVNAQKVGEALNQLDTGFTKTALAADLMGRNGKKLIPILQELGKPNGLLNLIASGRASGALIDEANIALFEDLNKKLQEMKVFATSATNQLLEGLGPSLVQVMGDATSNTDDAVSAINRLGQAIGGVLRLAKAITATLVLPLGELVTAILTGVATIGESFALQLQGKFVEAEALINTRRLKLVDLMKQDAASIGKAWTEAFTTPPALKTAPPGGGGAAGGRDDAAQAALESRREALQAGLRATLETNAAEAESDKAKYDRGLVALTTYYAERRAILQSNLNAEIKELGLEYALAADEKNADKRTALQAATLSKMTTAEQRFRTEVSTLDDDQEKDRVELNKQILAESAKLLDSEGQQYQAALAKIAEDRDRFLKLKVLSGIPIDEATKQVDAIAAIEKSRADFDLLLQQSQRALDAYQRARDQIQGDISSHQISQIEGEQKLAALDKARLPALQQAAAAVNAAGEGLGPDVAAKSDQFGDSLHRASVQAAQLQTLAGDALRSALDEAFSTGITRASTFLGVLEQIGLSIANIVERAAGSRIADAIAQFLFPSNSSPVPAGLSDAADYLSHYAAGGLISGPGGPLSDLVPIMASNGEYIATATMAAQPGAMAFLEAWRNGNFTIDQFIAAASVKLPPLRHYAEGGPIVAPGASGSTNIGGQVTIALDEGLILKAMESPAGQKVLIRVAAKNRRAYGAALRIGG